MNRKRVFIVSLMLMLVLTLQAFAETPVYKEGSRGAGPGSTAAEQDREAPAGSR